MHATLHSLTPKEKLRRRPQALRVYSTRMLTERHSGMLGLLALCGLGTLVGCSGSGGGDASTSDASGTPTSGGTSTATGTSATTAMATSSGTTSTPATGATASTSAGVGTTGSGGGTGTGSAASTTSQGGATSDTSGETGGSTTGGTPVELSIEPNPNSVLSAYVSWTTPEPATSLVQFGAGELSWEIEGEAAVTEHRVLVIGMRGDTLYQMRALSTGATGSFQGDGSFMTGSVPSQIPNGTISVHTEDTQPGWTLMNVQKGDGTNRALSGAPPAAVIYDEEGYPVWYWINGTQAERGGAISVDRTDVGVLMGPSETTAPKEVDWAGNEVWACGDLRCGGSASLSHHAMKLTNGNYVVMRDTPSGSRTSQVFEELSAGSDQPPLHTIGVEDAITPPSSASGDWAHGNSLTVDLENDVAYMSFRWLGVVKMQYSTKTMLWHLPASYGAQGMGDMTFVPADSQFSDIHDPEIHDDGTILFFDNGGYTGVIEDGNPSNLHTRAVEYMIDEQAKTATLAWEWPGDFDTDPWYKQDLYVPFWGDADRLENGNVLIAAGRRGTVEITPESRIIEVKKDTGAVVWEMLLPKDHGVYRAERLYPLPLVRPIQ